MRRTFSLGGCLIALGLALSPAAQAQIPSSPDTAVGTVIVVSSTPLPGVGVDIDKLPNTIQTLGAASLTREGSASLTTTLNNRLGGVNINDDLDDPFQPDILFRGFEASPVLGTPDGLAVYQNGVRVNEAFGDGVNWDLFPDVAVNRLTVFSSNPVYGLNALGGAVVIDMKNGFTYQDGQAEVSGGSWGQRSLTLQYGSNVGAAALYIAGRALDQDGWREFSPDRLRQFYADISYHAPRLSLDLSITGADNLLSGESATPVQELAVSRSLVFTSPQHDRNGLAFFTVNGSYELRKDLSIQANAYYRDYRQGVVNGNTTDYAACTIAPYHGALCQPNGTTPLTNAAGAPLPDISQDGAFVLGEIDRETIHSSGLGGTLQATETGALFGHENHLSVAGSTDSATTNFGSSTEVGIINAALVVGSPVLVVDTPENTPWTATPVRLLAITRYDAVFATDTLNLSGTFAMTVSARDNYAQINLADRLGLALTGRSAYNRLNPALGFTQKLTDSLTAFAGYSEGNRAPTPSEIECSNPARPCLLPSSLSSDPPTLRQVVSRAWEAGVRGQFSAQRLAQGRFTWSADVFRTDVTDDIYGVATSQSAGYFQNIGGTRRQGADLSVKYQGARLSFFFDYSHVDATFQSTFLLPSPENRYANANGDILVRPGDVLPGIPAERLKIGVELQATQTWLLGADLVCNSGQIFRGDESNRMKPLAGYAVLNLHTSYQLGSRTELFINVMNASNVQYATLGVLGDPPGIGAPGIPPGPATNGAGADYRFESPAPPISAFAGVRFRF